MADNVLTRKLGPLPTWAWLGIATAGVGAYYLVSGGSLGSLTGSSSSGSSSSGSSSVPDNVYQIQNQIPPQAPTPDRDHGGKHPKPRGRKPPIPLPPYHHPYPKPHHHGHPHGHKKGVLTASGHYDLQETARGHGISEEQLEAMNPQLRHLEGTGRPIPRGTKVRY
jgi:hypothetical protein